MTQLFHFEPDSNAPIVCDFSGAADTPKERLVEYGRLFEIALVSSERTPESIVLTFDPAEDIAAWVADLATREAACCPFMRYDVTADDTQIRWVISAPAEMQPMLDDYFTTYEEMASVPTDQVLGGLAERGFAARTGDGWWTPVPAPQAGQKES